MRKYSRCRKHNIRYLKEKTCPYCGYEQLGLKVGFVELDK